MMASLVGSLSWLLAQAPAVEDQLALDSQILAEQFYFFTVVTPTFYYFGWYIYGCFEHGGPAQGHAGPDPEFPGFCGATAPWDDAMGPNLQDHISAVFFLAFLLFSWTTGSIMSGAVIERIRLSAYLILTVLLGSAVWIMDAAWGWSSGGWLTMNYGFHDSIASLVVHGVAGAFTLGVLLNLGPRIGKFDREGRARTFKGHNTHLTLMGLMLILTGFYGFYAACLFITSTSFPGWLNIYGSFTTLGAIAMVITFGFAGGFTGGWVASKGDPFWTLSGGLAGVISVSAGADVYHPSLAYILAFSGGLLVVWVGVWIERTLRVDDAVGAVAVHGFSGFYGLFLVGIFAGGYPTGVENVESSMGGQLVGILTFLPLGFLPGFFAAWLLKQFNLLRVPPEVELEGLDMAEVQQDFFPEFERVPETIVLPTGEAVDSAAVLLEAYSQLTNGQRSRDAAAARPGDTER